MASGMETAASLLFAVVRMLGIDAVVEVAVGVAAAVAVGKEGIERIVELGMRP